MPATQAAAHRYRNALLTLGCRAGVAIVASEENDVPVILSITRGDIHEPIPVILGGTVDVDQVLRHLLA
jgi:hypothetical protein